MSAWLRTELEGVTLHWTLYACTKLAEYVLGRYLSLLSIRTLFRMKCNQFLCSSISVFIYFSPLLHFLRKECPTHSTALEAEHVQDSLSIRHNINTWTGLRK